MPVARCTLSYLLSAKTRLSPVSENRDNKLLTLPLRCFLCGRGGQLGGRPSVPLGEEKSCFRLALTRRPMTVSRVDRCQQVRQGHALGVPAAFEDAGGGLLRPVAVVGHGDEAGDGLAVAPDGQAPPFAARSSNRDKCLLASEAPIRSIVSFGSVSGEIWVRSEQAASGGASTAPHLCLRGNVEVEADPVALEAVLLQESSWNGRVEEKDRKEVLGNAPVENEGAEAQAAGSLPRERARRPGLRSGSRSRALGTRESDGRIGAEPSPALMLVVKRMAPPSSELVLVGFCDVTRNSGSRASGMVRPYAGARLLRRRVRNRERGVRRVRRRRCAAVRRRRSGAGG